MTWMQPRRTSSFGRHRLHGGALEDDRALRDVAALGAQQIGDRLQRRGLARAIGAEQRNETALRHGERNALQDEDHVVVDDLDIVDGKNGRRRLRALL